MAHPETPQASGSVLIVDDNADTREMYDLALAKSGFRVLQAENGTDGLAVAAEALPDVIVTDLAMPRLDGVELLTRVQADPRTERIPVIILSGWTDPDTSRCALDAGAVAFILKPCDPASLVEEVRRVVSRASPEAVHRSATSA
jgi:DNA-binding response OmpR family regulator